MSYTKVSNDYDGTCTETDKVSVQAAPSFVGKGVYTGAVLELEKILDTLFTNPTPGLKAVLENLSPDKFKRLARLHKSLQSAKGGAFKWASTEEIEKEALFGLGAKKDSLTLLDKVLKKYLEQSGESSLDILTSTLPGMVRKKLDSLNAEIEKNIAKRPIEPSKSPKEPGLLEKGQDVGRVLKEKGQEVGKAIGEKAKEVGKAVGEKAKNVAEAPGKFMGDVKKRYQQYQEERIEKQRQLQESQAKADKDLKIFLAKRTPYDKIFYSLPPEIIKELNTIGLDPESVSSLGISSKKPVSKPKISPAKKTKVEQTPTKKVEVRQTPAKKTKVEQTSTAPKKYDPYNPPLTPEGDVDFENLFRSLGANSKVKYKIASDVVLRFLRSQDNTAVGETVKSSSVGQSRC